MSKIDEFFNILSRKLPYHIKESIGLNEWKNIFLDELIEIGDEVYGIKSIDRLGRITENEQVKVKSVTLVSSSEELDEMNRPRAKFKVEFTVGERSFVEEAWSAVPIGEEKEGF